MTIFSGLFDLFISVYLFKMERSLLCCVEIRAYKCHRAHVVVWNRRIRTECHKINGKSQHCEISLMNKWQCMLSKPHNHGQKTPMDRIKVTMVYSMWKFSNPFSCQLTWIEYNQFILEFFPLISSNTTREMS